MKRENGPQRKRETERERAAESSSGSLKRAHKAAGQKAIDKHIMQKAPGYSPLATSRGSNSCKARILKLTISSKTAQHLRKIMIFRALERRRGTKVGSQRQQQHACTG